MAEVPTSNISFSVLKAAYVAGGQTDAAHNGPLRDGETDTAIQLSFFRNAGFTDPADPSSVPSGSNTISIDSHFKGNTFGSGGGGC